MTTTDPANAAKIAAWMAGYLAGYVAGLKDVLTEIRAAREGTPDADA